MARRWWLNSTHSNDLDDKPSESSRYAFSPTCNSPSLKGSSTSPNAAVAIRILRQILLVIVGAGALSCAEIVDQITHSMKHNMHVLYLYSSSFACNTNRKSSNC